MRLPPAATTRRSSSTISAASGAITAIASRRSWRNEARASSTRRRTESSAGGATRISGSIATKYGKGRARGGPGYSGHRPTANVCAMTRFQKLALATAATTIALFTVGGLVRGTGSGLGCSSWPACEPGRLFPTGTIHSLIEFTHRLLAFAVILLASATAIVAWLRHRGDRALLWSAVAAVPLVLGQAVVGAIVVRTDLDPGWATAPAARPDAGRSRFARLTLVTAAFTACLLLVGTYVRASGSQLVFTDWPLMGGRLVPTLGGAATAMFLHRVLAAASLLLTLWLAIRARTLPRRSQRQKQ